MTKIDLVFNDIDGCFGNFKKPKAYPEKQSLAGHEDLLAKIKTFVEAHPEVKFSACTGRSLYLCDNIIEATGMNEISAVEMGQEIYNPLTKECYGLLRRLYGERRAKSGLTLLRHWTEVADGLREFMQTSAQYYDYPLKLFFRGSNIRRMQDNRNMLTYEFDDVITGEAVFQFMEPHLYESVRNGIKEGIIKVVPSKKAVDVRTFINKGHAIDHILEKLKRTGEACLGIGDSYHSDIDMLNCCEHVACPANSDDKLKDYVSGRKGHIARQTFGEGVLEIYGTLI